MAVREQAVHQHDVRSGPKRQVKIGLLRGFRPPRIDHDQPRPAGCARRHDALIDDRMAPGGVRTDEQDQIGLVQIVVAGGHHVLAERALVGGHGARHAQPGIGVDIGGADEALHQLVGDVIILGQQLPRHVEGDAVRAVLRDRLAKSACDEVQRLVPGGASTTDHRIEQSSLEPHRLAQMGALGAQLPPIGGVVRIAAHLDRPIARARREYAAPDAAIGAGRAHRPGHVKPRSGQCGPAAWPVRAARGHSPRAPGSSAYSRDPRPVLPHCSG